MASRVVSKKAKNLNILSQLGRALKLPKPSPAEMKRHNALRKAFLRRHSLEQKLPKAKTPAENYRMKQEIINLSRQIKKLSKAA